MKIAQGEKLRYIIIIAAALIAGYIVYEPLSGLFASKLYRDYHSLIPFIPLISVYLLYLKRKEIWATQEIQLRTGSGGCYHRFGNFCPGDGLRRYPGSK